MRMVRRLFVWTAVVLLVFLLVSDLPRLVDLLGDALAAVGDLLAWAGESIEGALPGGGG